MNFKALETQQKLRGGYYTPAPIAELLSRWILSRGATTILEPSCGDGVFLRALAAQAARTMPAPRLAVDAVEIVAEEAAKSAAVGELLRTSGVDIRVFQHDIFSWLAHESSERQWNAILGNPPYVRYQYFEKDQRELAERLFARVHIPFSRRTNLWVSLVLACVVHLEPGGSLALVLPAELLHIQHAGGLRQLLEQEMETITLLNIRTMVFPNVLQGVVLLLATKKRNRLFQPFMPHKNLGTPFVSQLSSTGGDERPASISLLDLDDLASLRVLSLDQLATSTTQRINDTHGKWMFGLLSESEASLVKKICAYPTVQAFVAIASVDIGVVTGANAFFVVDKQTLERFELASIASPMLARSDLIKGITYTRCDHEANEEAGKAVFLLKFPALQQAELPVPMASYISGGEAQKLHERYKCRIRDPWYVVPYIWPSEIALLKRCHLFPRLVVNELGAHSTDTAYRIRLHAATTGRARDLVFSFLNSLTFLYAELGGRHYGGGVLELVPSEIEALPIPLQRVEDHVFAAIDSMIRNRIPLEELLAITDPLILGQGLGLTEQEIQLIQAAHRRLLKRRLRI